MSAQAATEGATGTDFPASQPIVAVRPARRDEMPAIVDLISRAHAETYAPSPAAGARYLADVHAKAAGRRHRFWWTYRVAESGGRIVGVVQTVFNTVNALYVEADRRGRGIGSQLLVAAEVALRDKGVGTVRVRVAETFPRVIAFYERQGWRVMGPAETYKHEPEWGVRLLEMRKLLGAANDARRSVDLLIVKAVLCAAAVAAILLVLGLTHAIGMAEGASAAVGGMLAMIVGRFVLGLRSPHFGIGRTFVLAAAGTGIYLVVPLLTIALGWFCLQVLGLQEQAAHDQTMTSIFVLCALGILSDRPARYAAARVWERYA